MKTTRILAILVLVLVVGLPAGVANADFTFGTPTNLGPTVNSTADEWGPSISADGLSLYFSGPRPGGYGSWDIWETTRDTIDDDWGEPTNLGPKVNSPQGDSDPSISADGLSLFFASKRPGGYGVKDIWVSTRQTKDADWGTPVNLGPTVNSAYREDEPSISAYGSTLYFISTRPGGLGGYDLWVTTWATINEPWGPPVNLGAVVNSSTWDGVPCISADGLLLFFHSNRSGGYGGGDLWVTRRATINDPWGEPVNLGPPVNSSAYETCASISADGLFLYFCSDRPGGLGGTWGDIYQAPIIPIVDFNGDGIVDSADMCIMVDHWGEDYPLCDIGPMPWGDGIVDVQDLIILAEYLFTYPGAVAHWKLDETEGDIAFDSTGVNDSVVFGDAVWQPDGGMVDGALQFNGIDDYVSTPFVLDPVAGNFSVFGWINGGGPGQVVLSQADGMNWLMLDPTNGMLMTELRSISGRTAQPPLLSQTLITDGVWHRIGFVCDSTHRMLYVDDVEVAKDTHLLLESSEGGLYFGADSTLEPASFFSGLIDDVRIYNRAIIP